LIRDIIIAMLWSVSPLGEAKVGIPYGLTHDLNIYLVFAACFLANVLVFPIMLFFLDNINRHLLKWTYYKKAAINIARRAKIGSGNVIQKYGFFGLIFFVMLPIPGTGVYAGTIATYMFKIDRKKAFWANVIGIFISSVIVWIRVFRVAKYIENYFLLFTYFSIQFYSKVESLEVTQIINIFYGKEQILTQIR